MRRLSPIYAAASTALVVALGGCGASSGTSTESVQAHPTAAEPAALHIARTLFIPGERMEFEMSLHGIKLGRAHLAAGDPGDIDGKQIIIVRSQIEGSGAVSIFKKVRDDVTSWVSVETGLPIYLKADVKFGEKEAQIETRFNHGAAGSFHVEYRRPGRPSRTLHQRMPENRAAFDGHSILGALRSWDGKVGEHAFFYVLSGRRLWQSTIRFTRREKIATAMGRVSAIRIDGVGKRLSSRLTEDKRKKPRHYTLWLSDDAERRPLLVTGQTEFGDVKVELVDYSRPDAIVAVE
jgi:hypothetical protein